MATGTESMTDQAYRSQCSDHLAPADRRRTRRRMTGWHGAACLLLGVSIAVGGLVGVAAADVPGGGPSTARTASSSAATSLPGLLVQPRDTTSALSVRLLPHGDQVKGQPTLDLCNQRFPSESLRTERRQDVATDSSGAPVLSTEAVLYRNAAATKQAFRELRHVARSCPKGPVPGSGNGSTTTTFGTTPDTDWPQTDSVERQAFSLTTTDAGGATTKSLAVYLRRGRVLLGVYFSNPDREVPPIEGHTEPADIVSAFATRIARLPASVVADPVR